jgi:hypothetical protein
MSTLSLAMIRRAMVGQVVPRLRVPAPLSLAAVN